MTREYPAEPQALAILSTTATGIITSVNGAAERLLGYSADQIVGSVSLLAVRGSAELKLCSAADTSASDTSTTYEFETMVANATPGHQTESGNLNL